MEAETGGGLDARDRLVPLVYRELRRLAARQLRGEREHHTLATTGLVHEAYLRLAGQDDAYQNRAQFLALAARMMRRVLIDHARARAAAKRPRPELQVALDETIASGEPGAFELLSLDRALRDLATLDPRQAELVELRYFGGLTEAEAAEALGVSPATVKRDWRLAKAWLHRSLCRESSAAGELDP